MMALSASMCSFGCLIRSLAPDYTWLLGSTMIRVRVTVVHQTRAVGGASVPALCSGGGGVRDGGEQSVEHCGDVASQVLAS